MNAMHNNIRHNLTTQDNNNIRHNNNTRHNNNARHNKSMTDMHISNHKFTTRSLTRPPP